MLLYIHLNYIIHKTEAYMRLLWETLNKLFEIRRLIAQE